MELIIEAGADQFGGAELGCSTIRSSTRTAARSSPAKVDPVAVSDMTVVDDPAEAEVALIRLTAPFEPRSDLILESYFHQSSLDFPPSLVSRLARIAGAVPVVSGVTLDRPAILTPLTGVATALVVSYGSSDHALLDALTGRTAPQGRLPIDIPRSMEAVRRSPRTNPGCRDPLFCFGDGPTLRIRSTAGGCSLVVRRRSAVDNSYGERTSRRRAFRRQRDRVCGDRW